MAENMRLKKLMIATDTSEALTMGDLAMNLAC